MLGFSYIITASIFEIAWAFGLKNAVTFGGWFLTIICILMSFLFLVLATKAMAASMAYVFFVIFGTIGTYLIDVFIFDKAFSFLAISSITIMMMCVVILKKGE
ncbi:hypothetical protein QHJ03_004026 [Salmonella enterica]|uniref:DMT family transporter n=1 Tax=Salmonella enterica TaxID=28901 RepID=UPI00071C4EA2|nr:SMR family transporter [Salmonella enterica]EBM9478497.1 quaternary ammonium compound-resistance protein SugE [Salmonella enterica subsp. enterica serovar Rubislaw]ECT6468433.1 quaternary ammonium compound-resistance protein SugE [Salmonella enterica subsp. enterica serovar Senegal]EHC8527869.1 quaternary ammonium compound-resistance protein SugE [Salmonella enterica subsp. enterica serovar 11:r:-]EAQ5803287.1 quaternary ammonium compound-resistance protein SugE [Salmonella enterica]EBO3245